MKIRNPIEQPNDWRRFDLNVGGFCIRGCRWHVPAGWITFPYRYSYIGRRYPVVFVHGRHVLRLRDLLESGQTETPRDRRSCTLGIRLLGRSRHEDRRWLIFDFTVRGFTILGCRWQPESGSIQLPATFLHDEEGRVCGKKLVVCAYGAHINRLRHALEAELAALDGERLVIPDEAQDAVPA